MWVQSVVGGAQPEVALRADERANTCAECFLSPPLRVTRTCPHAARVRLAAGTRWQTFSKRGAAAKQLPLHVSAAACQQRRRACTRPSARLPAARSCYAMLQHTQNPQSRQRACELYSTECAFVSSHRSPLSPATATPLL
jgi:hypothetical protein